MPLVTLTRPAGAGRHHRDTPVERGVAGDRRQTVSAGLEERDPAGQELVAGEVAVVVGVGCRRRDVVVVDQAHQVAEGFDRLGVIEGELVVALEHAAGRADVVEIDGLGVVGGVVPPLADSSGSKLCAR